MGGGRGNAAALIGRAQATQQLSLTLETNWTQTFVCGHFLTVLLALSTCVLQRSCQALGGNLASIHNLLEYHAVQYVVMRACHRNRPTWVGGSDAQEVFRPSLRNIAHRIQPSKHQFVFISPREPAVSLRRRNGCGPMVLRSTTSSGPLGSPTTTAASSIAYA